MAEGFSSKGCESGGGERFRPWQRLRGQRAFRRERNVGVYRHSAAALVRILPPWEADFSAGAGNVAGGEAIAATDRVAGCCNQGTGRRLGVVASRKVGNAVARNRAKRVFREVFRLNQHLLPVDCDVLVIVRKDFAAAQRADVEALFADAARRARRAFGGG